MHPEFPDVWPSERMEMDVDKSRGIRERNPDSRLRYPRRSVNGHVLFPKIASPRGVSGCLGVIGERGNLSKSEERTREDAFCSFGCTKVSTR